ncbi:MAG: phosphatidylinositol mannoside acyltransferase [Actinomycetes bacterium]
MRDLSGDASGLAFAAGWSAVRRMPAPMAGATFRGLADQAWLRHGKSVQQLEKNLRRVVPDASTRELRELSRESMRSYLRYWCEAFRLPDLTHEQILATHICVGEENIVQGLQSGRGAIMTLAHSGNWDHAGAWLALSHGRFTTVAERLRPESLYERFLSYRRSLGMEVLPLTGEGGPFRTLLERARAGGMICLLGDRDLTEHGVQVTFFGEVTKMPAGPAALAIASGAPLLPATLWFGDRRSWTRIHEEIPVPPTGTRAEKVAVMTQACADVFQQGISEHPEDWHMLQRLWLADLPAGRR